MLSGNVVLFVFLQFMKKIRIGNYMLLSVIRI